MRRIPSSTVRVAGISGSTLIAPDLFFDELENSCHLVYASIEKMAEEIDDFDYFVNIEDDVLLEPSVFSEIVSFDREHSIEECLLPNRMEKNGDAVSCVDLKATPGWTDRIMQYKNATLRVAISPHSGLFVLSRDKFRFALERVDISRRDRIIGGLMASAFANIHSPFLLFRPYEPPDFLTVTHLDHWEDPYGVS